MNWTFLRAHWRDVVEILLLTVGIYYPLLFLRGTRGWAVVIGFLVLLLALVFVTGVLEFKVLGVLLGGFSAFLAMAVLVIFQPELRRILAELGNLPIFATAREQRENIEVIIKTVERLSDVRIGMLVAIEQSIQLQEVVESGIMVDCEATPEMLETIFFPNNAIHDGGVIIKGDRIAYQKRSEGRFDIWTVGLSGDSEPMQLTDGNGSNEYPSWSPDGRYVAFSSTRGRHSQIYIMMVKNRKIISALTEGEGNDSCPAWSWSLGD
jgi:DNA integrity scanning protein DisA with diadenylate cyclase activity